jgi:hypothetical protein
MSPGCRYIAADQPRALNGRHTATCDDNGCRGCAPCPEPHCQLCGIEHLANSHPQTCPSCVGSLRADLEAIDALYGTLPDQATNGGQDGRLTAAAPIPGGDALVMLAPASDGTQATDHEHESRTDPTPPLLVLSTWEDDWRRHLDHDRDIHATVPNAIAYLATHLSLMAQRHDGLEGLATDLTNLRRRLEDILRAGERDERGAPCIHCGTMLIRLCTDKGLQDEWRCHRCHRRYGNQAYYNAVAATYKAHAPALTATDMHSQYGVEPGTLRAWASRKKVRRRGHDLQGRVLYDVNDTLKCLGLAGVA